MGSKYLLSPIFNSIVSCGLHCLGYYYLYCNIVHQKSTSSIGLISLMYPTGVTYLGSSILRLTECRSAIEKSKVEIRRFKNAFWSVERSDRLGRSVWIEGKGRSKVLKVDLPVLALFPYSIADLYSLKHKNDDPRSFCLSSLPLKPSPSSELFIAIVYSVPRCRTLDTQMSVREVAKLYGSEKSLPIVEAHRPLSGLHSIALSVLERDMELKKIGGDLLQSQLNQNQQPTSSAMKTLTNKHITTTSDCLPLRITPFSLDEGMIVLQQSTFKQIRVTKADICGRSVDGDACDRCLEADSDDSVDKFYEIEVLTSWSSSFLRNRVFNPGKILIIVATAEYFIIGMDIGCYFKELNDIRSDTFYRLAGKFMCML
ncbi:hypothetical protein Scep_004342 [Stephania cephalantha]|uniref:Uncharacterized protein n=1 Tax=Stephania cephalantha TaxID=152367 RepID=A0AAP0KSA5_9MAGN